ncbi:hypothetical protein, partial [Pseudomonas avellanae]|uniref:hypothetical protein n=2 Tax=Pseudomonas syringae group TaxID=136849 RepID=UPI001C558E64
SGRYLGRSFLRLQRCNQQASIDDFTEHLFLRQYTSMLSHTSPTRFPHGTELLAQQQSVLEVHVLLALIEN